MKDGLDYYIWRQGRGELADEESERLASLVIGAAIEVHRHVGAGLPESVYQKAMCHEFRLRNVSFVSQAPVPVFYKSEPVGYGYADLLVGGRLVVELKAIESLTDTHRAQVYAYLSALDLRLGLLINFNVDLLKQGLRRVVRDPKRAS
jgi:GxxExxY protein